MNRRTLSTLTFLLIAAAPSSAWSQGQLSKVPRLIKFVKAEPPPALEARGSADVVLTIDISAGGEVVKVAVAESAGEGGFDEAAVEAARQFVFEPGEADGKPVPVRITYKYHFFLEETATATVAAPAPEPEKEAAPPPPQRSQYASTVRGQKPVEQTVAQTLGAEEVRRIPGTQGDTLKAVQNLPGVARAPFGGGLLVVWGAAPGDTRTYIDGVYVPTLYHFGGVRSTFNSERVEKLSFFPGGYGAELGRGLGGVIEVESRPPRTDAMHGFLQLDLFDGSAAFEGPLTKDLSFAVSVRRSWVDAFLPLLTSNEFQLSPVYYDYQADLHWHASSRDEVDFHAFGSDDVLRLIVRDSDPTQSPHVDSHTYYHRGLARWKHSFDGGATSETTLSLGYDVPFQFNLNVGHEQRGATLQTFEYTLREKLQIPLSDTLRLDAGLDFEGNRWPIDVMLGASGPPRDGDAFDYYGAGVGAGTGSSGAGVASDRYTLFTHNLAPYVGARLSFLEGRLTIAPQLRVEVMAFSGSQFGTHTFAYAEPRLAVKYRLLPWLTPKLAFGIYHQAPAPLDFSSVFGNSDLRPETALQYVAGVDLDPFNGLHLELAGFYKDLRGLIVRGEQGDPPLTNDGVGRAYGGELMVRAQLSDRFFGWISYTLSRSERRDHPDSAWRPFEYDQTHILTAVASYKLADDLQLGVRFRYVTGNPYTPVLGSYYDAGADKYNPLYGSIYGGRMGSFHQIDLRLDKSFNLGPWKLSLYLDLQNVYNRANPEGLRYNFDYSRSQPQAGLPFLPVIGIRGEF